jgi:hypothetical protein
MTTTPGYTRCRNTDDGECHRHAEAAISVTIDGEVFSTMTLCTLHLVGVMVRNGIGAVEAVSIISSIGQHIARDILTHHPTERP